MSDMLSIDVKYDPVEGMQFLTGNKDNKRSVVKDDKSSVPTGLKGNFDELLTLDIAEYGDILSYIREQSEALRNGEFEEGEVLNFLGRDFTAKKKIQSYTDPQGKTTHRVVFQLQHLMITKGNLTGGISIKGIYGGKNGMRVTFWSMTPKTPRRWLNQVGDNVDERRFSGVVTIEEVNYVTIKKQDSERFQVGDQVPKLLVLDTFNKGGSVMLWNEPNSDLSVFQAGQSLELENFSVQSNKYGISLGQSENSSYTILV